MAGFKYERDEIYRFHLHGNEFSSREKETRLGKVALCNGNNRMIGDIGARFTSRSRSGMRARRNFRRR